MAKALSKKLSSVKYDVIIKAKSTTMQIININNEMDLRAMRKDKSLDWTSLSARLREYVDTKVRFVFEINNISIVVVIVVV
jgi:hypothetical protein